MSSGVMDFAISPTAPSIDGVGGFAASNKTGTCCKWSVRLPRNISHAGTIPAVKAMDAARMLWQLSSRWRTRTGLRCCRSRCVDLDLLARLSQLVQEPMLEFLIVCVFSHRRSFWSSLIESVNQVAEVRRFRTERPAARAMRRCPTPVIATAATQEKSKK